MLDPRAQAEVLISVCAGPWRAGSCNVILGLFQMLKGMGEMLYLNMHNNTRHTDVVGGVKCVPLPVLNETVHWVKCYSATLSSAT